MERDSHYTVCGVERLLDSISVVDVDVNVQHPLQSQVIELLHNLLNNKNIPGGTWGVQE